MNKKVKTTKFKVINAKINKNLVGEEFDMQEIKPKVDTNNTTPTKKQKSTRDLLIEFMTEQRSFNVRIGKEVVNLRSDVSILRNDVVNLSARIDNLVKVNSLKE